MTNPPAPAEQSPAQVSAGWRVTHVNVGLPAELHGKGRTLLSGIVKRPVHGRVVARGVNLAGDGQADRSVHGGVDKAVYAYAWEDHEWWQRTEGITVTPGLFGENLTLCGVDLRQAVVGERWRVGATLLEVAQPRLPCLKLGLRLGDSGFPRRFLAAGRTGAYLRIVHEGDVGEGDSVELVSRPSHGITLADMVAALRDGSAAARLAEVPGLPSFWQGVAGRDA